MKAPWSVIPLDGHFIVTVKTLVPCFICMKYINFIRRLQPKALKNKKVLLRERKRHTDRGVSSTPPVNQSRVPPRAGPPRQGYPWPGLMRGYPRWGTPWQGYPPTGPGLGTPPPMWTDRQCQNITFPRTSYVVGNNK